MQTAPEQIKAMMPQIRKVEHLLVTYGYTKGTPEWDRAFRAEWAFCQKFGIC